MSEDTSIRVKRTTVRKLWELVNNNNKTLNDVIESLLVEHDRKISGGPGI